MLGNKRPLKRQRKQTSVVALPNPVEPNPQDRFIGTRTFGAALAAARASISQAADAQLVVNKPMHEQRTAQEPLLRKAPANPKKRNDAKKRKKPTKSAIKRETVIVPTGATQSPDRLAHLMRRRSFFKPRRLRRARALRPTAIAAPHPSHPSISAQAPSARQHVITPQGSEAVIALIYNRDLDPHYNAITFDYDDNRQYDPDADIPVTALAPSEYAKAAVYLTSAQLNQDRVVSSTAFISLDVIKSSHDYPRVYHLLESQSNKQLPSAGDLFKLHGINDDTPLARAHPVSRATGGFSIEATHAAANRWDTHQENVEKGLLKTLKQKYPNSDFVFHKRVFSHYKQGFTVPICKEVYLDLYEIPKDMPVALYQMTMCMPIRTLNPNPPTSDVSKKLQKQALALIEKWRLVKPLARSPLRVRDGGPNRISSATKPRFFEQRAKENMRPVPFVLPQAHEQEDLDQEMVLSK